MTIHSSCGLTYLEKYFMNRHNSQAQKGASFLATTVDALANGFIEGFQGKYFYDYTSTRSDECSYL